MKREPGQLTARQAQCLNFIRRSIAERGFPPTLREIGREMGIGSTNGVTDHLLALERKKYIVRPHDMTRRSIRLTETITVAGAVPQLGIQLGIQPRATDPGERVACADDYPASVPPMVEDAL